MKSYIRLPSNCVRSVIQKFLKLNSYLRCRHYSLIAATLFHASAFSVEVDPFVGIYKADVAYTPYAVIKKHDGRYFAVVSTGAVELLIEEDGSFRAKNQNIPISGQFEHKVDGKYQDKVTSLFGARHVYKREALKPQDYVPAMYSDSKFFSQFSHRGGEQCAAPYPDAQAATSQVIKQSPRMGALVKKIEQGSSDYANINSLLVLKDGKLVFERYFNGWKADEPHTIQSVSKSLTSLLAGIAAKQGYIKDVNDPASAYLPAYKDYFAGDKGKITLKHLLTMSPGLYWDEWSKSYEDPENLRSKEMASDDSVAFTLSQPMSHAPGKQFTYSGGTVSVVGEIIRTASNQPSVSDYAMTGPLSALCFKNAFWMKQNDQRSNVAGGVMLRPRDMLKLGQLVIDEGQWHGKQLVDPAWLKESTKPALPTGLPGNKYSYFWWNTAYLHKGKTYPAVNALGYGGQEIIIVKDLDLVVVKTANNFHTHSLIGKIMAENILPAFAG